MKLAIVILHGWGSRVERWQPLKKELEKAGFEVFLPHLPGFGKTEPPPEAWGIGDYAAWIKERLPKNYFLVGHSFGGRIAIKLASEKPEGLKKLILIDSAGIRPKKTLKHFIFLFLAKIGKLFFLIPPFLFCRNLARKVLYQLAGERDYYQAKGVMRETLKKVIREDLRGDLKKIKVPTLILWGAKDKMTPLVDGKLMNSLIVNSYLKVFPDSGHDLPLSLSRKTAREIINFSIKDR